MTKMTRPGATRYWNARGWKKVGKEWDLKDGESGSGVILYGELVYSKYRYIVLTFLYIDSYIDVIMKDSCSVVERD